jgi:hypothetical protein
MLGVTRELLLVVTAPVNPVIAGVAAKPTLRPGRAAEISNTPAVLRARIARAVVAALEAETWVVRPDVLSGRGFLLEDHPGCDTEQAGAEPFQKPVSPKRHVFEHRLVAVHGWCWHDFRSEL